MGDAQRPPRVNVELEEDFRTVVLVAPIWMYRLAGPMRSFVARERDAMRMRVPTHVRARLEQGIDEGMPAEVGDVERDRAEGRQHGPEHDDHDEAVAHEAFAHFGQLKHPHNFGAQALDDRWRSACGPLRSASGGLSLPRLSAYWGCGFVGALALLA